MRGALTVLAILIALGAGGGWWLSAPETAAPIVTAGIEPDLDRGRAAFHAGGCASCHAAEGATGEARLVMSGGRALVSDFGTFYAPNISPDPTHGIGGWSALDMVNAMRHGVTPDGRHYYPAFPYTAYRRATTEDIVSLFAFLQTLPASDTPNRPHDLSFPVTLRRGIGLWKRLYLTDDWAVAEAELNSDPARRGRYLAEALAHCGECHTPRDGFGGLDTAAWLSGAPNPTGQGRIPNITPAALDWSEADIAAYLRTGFTPEFDTAGGSMAEVIAGLAELAPEETDALAAYLKAVPPVE